MSHLFLTGAVLTSEALEYANFDPTDVYAGCCICGRLFQPDRELALWEKLERKRKWQMSHAKTHTQRQHDELRESGRAFTPEAAHVLASVGVIPLTDLGVDELTGRREVVFALAEAPRKPTQEVET